MKLNVALSFERSVSAYTCTRCTNIEQYHLTLYDHDACSWYVFFK